MADFRARLWRTEWKIGSKKIPVSPDKAWRIVTTGIASRARGAGDFVRMEIRSFDPSGSTGLAWEYFYRIEFIPMQLIHACSCPHGRNSPSTEAHP